MQSFSIRNIELLTGIKAHTLRIWEQRYDFFKAQRKLSNQRTYSNEDLKKLLCISFLYHNNWKVSKISALTDEQLREEVRKIPLSPANYRTYVQQLLEAALDFDEAAFLGVLNAVIEKIGFERAVLDVCYPYLVRTGLLWDTSNVIPAQEHFSSYLIQNRLIAETEKYASQQAGGPELVLFCPENEFHELPLLFLNYLLRKNHWRVFYLGKNISLAELREVARLSEVRFLYLHLLTNFTGVHVDDYLEMLRKSFPDKTIVASGRGIEQSQRTFVNTYILKRDEEILGFIESGKNAVAG